MLGLLLRESQPPPGEPGHALVGPQRDRSSGAFSKRRSNLAEAANKTRALGAGSYEVRYETKKDRLLAQTACRQTAGESAFTQCENRNFVSY